jgi:molybdopterin-guanine dinucleotide biosynthesis protein A
MCDIPPTIGSIGYPGTGLMRADMSANQIDDPSFVVFGYVLVGGRSRRMGADKSEILIEGQSALTRQLDLIQKFANNAFVVGRAVDSIDDPVKVLADRGGRQGPLDGIVTALHHANTAELPTHSGNSVSMLALIVAVDLWNIAVGDIERLCAVFHNPPTGLVTDVAHLRSSGMSGDQPLCALWRVTESLRVLDQSFNEGERSVVRAWTELRRTPVIVSESTLANINSPEDLERWKAQ